MEIKIITGINKYGYPSVDLKVGNQTFFLTRSLNRFEINYLVNRSNRLYVDVVQESYKGLLYDNLVIREKDGYSNEYIVIKGLEYNVKKWLIAEISFDKTERSDI